VKHPNFRALLLNLPLLTLLCVLGWGMHRTNVSLEGQSYRTVQAGDMGPLPDGKVLRVLSLGFDRLIADLFWLRTVNYIGDQTSADAGFPAAPRLAELVTDIDPQFETVYTVMNSVLTVLSRQPQAAVALLDKGIRHIDWWKLHFLQGYNHIFETKDYEKAAEQMRLAASKEGAPPYLSLLASRIYAQAGDPETAMVFVKARMDMAATDEERENLAERLRDLWVARDLGRIDAAIEAYKRAQGAAPRDVATLLQAGLLRNEPRDPHGKAYLIEDGVARAPTKYEKLELHFNP